MKVFLLFAAFGFVCGNCPDHWVAFEESCYLFVDEFVAWSTAQEICRVVRGKLVEIESTAENNFIKSQMKSHSLSNAWLGLHDFVHEGTFQTISSLQPPIFTSWAPGEPNNMGTHHEGGEDCVLINVSGNWDDYWCDDTHACAVICEMESTEGEIIG